MKTCSKQKWPAESVKMVKIEELIPYARNARTHSDEQVAQIAASIKEWGWTVPVLTDETGMLIAGHGRVMAARKLNITEVPTMTATGWTEAQKKAYVLADNAIALKSGWDTELLAIELADLHSEDFDLGLTGFDGAELSELMYPEDQVEAEAPDSSSKEIDVDDYVMGHTCPKCGFEFDSSGHDKPEETDDE